LLGDSPCRKEIKKTGAALPQQNGVELAESRLLLQERYGREEYNGPVHFLQALAN